MRQVVGMDLLAKADDALLRADIQWLPLKGIWLVLEGVYPDFDGRPMSDVDILVPPERYADARRVLRGVGFLETKTRAGEVAMVLSDGGFSLDLHAHLFAPACFDLPTDAVFARAQPPRERRGLRVTAPSPLDGFAHLVGHYVRGGIHARDAAHCRDFGRIIDHWQLGIEAIAAHMVHVGMPRAARFCLTQAGGVAAEPRLLEIVAALPIDPLGSRIARLAALLDRDRRLPRQLTSATLMLLSRDLPTGLSTVATQAGVHATRQLARLRGRSAG